jgi:hypothetical protein
VLAWGLLFLLEPGSQALVIEKVARALNQGGRFLFTAPKEPLEWLDAMTGRQSHSLGAQTYERLLRDAGLTWVAESAGRGRELLLLRREVTAEPRDHRRCAMPRSERDLESQERFRVDQSVRGLLPQLGSVLTETSSTAAAEETGHPGTWATPQPFGWTTARTFPLGSRNQAAHE